MLNPLIKQGPYSSTVFFKKQRAPNLETYLLDRATRKAGAEEDKLFPRSRLDTWRSCLLSSTPFKFVVQWHQSLILSCSLICAWFVFQASSQEGVQRGSPDLTARTLGLRSISEFHKEYQAAVLSLQRSL